MAAFTLKPSSPTSRQNDRANLIDSVKKRTAEVFGFASPEPSVMAYLNTMGVSVFCMQKVARLPHFQTSVMAAHSRESCCTGEGLSPSSTHRPPDDRRGGANA